MMRFVVLSLMAGLTALQSLAADPAPKVSWLDGRVLCAHTAHLTPDSVTQLCRASETNHPTGVVLDLRFTDGEAIDGLQAITNLWAGAPKMASASDKTKNSARNGAVPAGNRPLVILVNGQTSGAAADLALWLRGANLGILIGSTNVAGKLAPDIAVDVSPEDEQRFMEDPYLAPATNTLAMFMAKNDLLPIVDHMSEAQLVKKHIKDGEDEADEPLTPRVAPAQPVIRDPELARAVDLLKALTILNPSRS